MNTALAFEKTFKPESPETIEQPRVLEIGNQFWNKLRAKVGSRIINPRYVDIVFASKNIGISQALHRINLINPISEHEIVIVGIYDTDNGSIHFNIPYEEIDPHDLAEIITHELTHLLQDQEGKYPEMATKKHLNSQGIDNASPWEKEAYNMQASLAGEFLKSCKIL
jgi:hypothetical protein